MGFEAFDYSVNVISFTKEGKNYGMTCAWAMQVDYDKILCLLGAQSDTGHAVKVGDIIGVSALNNQQQEIAVTLGEDHSKEIDKLAGFATHVDDGAILIDEASRCMVCEVIDVMHLKGIEADNLIYLRVVKFEENNDEFLHFSDL